MSTFTNAIGIDVSKKTLDVHDYKLNKHKVFKNQTAGYEQILAWVNKNHNNELESMLFCFEDTGIYSLSLSLFMQENRLAYLVIPSLEMKRSMGMARGKNDKIDAFKIAEYGYLRRENITPTRMAPEMLLKINNPAASSGVVYFVIMHIKSLFRNINAYSVSKNSHLVIVL